MKSTLPTFLASLRGVIEALDPNIGALFDTHRIWRSEDEIKKDRAVFMVQGSSLLDTVDREGQNVTRFWFVDVQVEPVPMTNCSSEYRNTVKLTAFYQWEDDNSQEQILRNACVELLDKLMEREVQNTTLNTGEQYLGYLQSPPRMATGVEHAEIGGGMIVGHSATIEVTFFEEVPYV